MKRLIHGLIIGLAIVHFASGSWYYGGPSYEPPNPPFAPVIGPNPQYPPGEAWECFVCDSSQDTENSTAEPCLDSGYGRSPNQVYRSSNTRHCEICVKSISGSEDNQTVSRYCAESSACPRGNYGNETLSWQYQPDNSTTLYCCNVMLCNSAPFISVTNPMLLFSFISLAMCKLIQS